MPAPSPDEFYHLLFCDDLELYRARPGASAAPWQDLLFGAAPDAAQVMRLAEDGTAESRVRALAYLWLRSHGHAVPKRVLLGVVVEVPLDNGLDVLAAYADGGVRYINQCGKIAIVEPGGLRDTASLIARLMEVSATVIGRIGPWDQPRRPPPVKPNIRLSFVVSDGLYFGEGPLAAIQADALSGPVLRQATQLLIAVTAGAGN